jgi:ribosomal subunit interface protein
MQVNVNTDRSIEIRAGLDEHVKAVLDNAIGRFGEHVHRVDVHLSNENKEKRADGGNSCMMQAHVAGYAPVVVHEHSVSLRQAIANAGDKLQRALDSALGRLHDKQLHTAPPLAAES